MILRSMFVSANQGHYAPGSAPGLIQEPLSVPGRGRGHPQGLAASGPRAVRRQAARGGLQGSRWIHNCAFLGVYGCIGFPFSCV